MDRRASVTTALIFGLAVWPILINSCAAQSAPAIPRIIPPPGIEIPAEDEARLKQGVAALSKRVEQFRQSASDEDKDKFLPDVEIYLKAVRYAVENGEFFAKKDIASADQLLKQGNERLDQLIEGKTPWATARGLVVRGFRSRIDDTVQPYGLVIPEGVDLQDRDAAVKPDEKDLWDRDSHLPLYVWLHGRGNTMTDLQFIAQRQSKVGQIAPKNAIVLHPFGRYCNAFKFAGETDVQEAIHDTEKNYRIGGISREPVILWGFSMGGAGAWHLGAHYPFWTAVSPGAGFAETARYQNLDPTSVPPYERTLWGLYDVPNYVRNLFNMPVFAYSGELDKQIQAARVMEEAYKLEGRELPHLIGPGMGHKYHPNTLAELSRRMEELAVRGPELFPKQLHFQTRTLRYSRSKWLGVYGLAEHWKDSRVDARVLQERESIGITTRNVTAIALSPPWPAKYRTFQAGTSIDIDGTRIVLAEDQKSGPLNLVRIEDRWQIPSEEFLHRTFYNRAAPRKIPGLQGPIDDAFMDTFLVVTPSGKAAHPRVEAWVQSELAHFKDRWRRLFRGDLRTKRDVDVTDDDIEWNSLVLWGDRQSNRLMERFVDKLPIRWDAKKVQVGDQQFDAAGHVPCLIYPNPAAQPGLGKYIVLNSGITFREAHDRSNSLQTPKLPDWAVIDLSQPPDDKAPGKVVAAGFFDEEWQLK